MARKGRKDRGLFTRRLVDGSVVWGVRLSYQHRMRQFSPFPSKTEARAFYEKAKTEQREGRFFPERYEHRGIKVQTFIDRYLPTIQQKRTANEEQVFAAWWSQWYFNRPVGAVTAESLEEARRALLGGERGRYHRRRSPARVNRYTQWLHQVFNHPVNRPHLPRGLNPVSELKRFEEAEPPVIRATFDQQAALVKILAEETPDSVDWLKLAVCTGMRQSEQFLRPKSDVDLTEGLIVIPRPKRTTRPKYIILPTIALPIVERLMKTPGPWLIPDPIDPRQPFPIRRWYKSVFKRAVRQAGLPNGFTWHSLRHTWASRMMASNRDPRLLQQAGGWTSLKMVERYTHFFPEEIRVAMDRGAQPTTVSGTAPIRSRPRRRRSATR